MKTMKLFLIVGLAMVFANIANAQEIEILEQSTYEKWEYLKLQDSFDGSVFHRLLLKSDKGKAPYGDLPYLLVDCWDYNIYATVDFDTYFTSHGDTHKIEESFDGKIIGTGFRMWEKDEYRGKDILYYRDAKTLLNAILPYDTLRLRVDTLSYGEITTRFDVRGLDQAIDKLKTVCDFGESEKIERILEDLDIDSVISQILEETTPSQPVQAVPEPEPVALTSSEIERLRSLIVDNWNIGALSSEAKRVILTVRIRMDETGKPIEIELYNSDGGVNDKAVEVAFEVARKAITKGLENGHDLPKDKYDLWKEVLYTFNPEQMRNR